VGTIIITTVLGLLGLVFEVLRLRKFIVPFTVLTLLGVVGFNMQYWNLNAPFFNNMLYIDNHAVVFSGLLALLTALVIAMSGSFYKNDQERISDYVTLMVFALSGAIMMVSFGNLATLFLGIEILSVSSYILAGSKRKDLLSNEAGLKYFLMGAFSTGFLLMGIALIYGITGSFDLEKIAGVLMYKQPSPLLMTGIGMFVVAMFFKASIAPFHFWAPDVYTGAPSLVTSFMSTVGKVAVFAAMYRLFVYTFGMQMASLEQLIILFIILTLIIGNFSGLWQSNLKRIMAYSGVSHAGFMLLAVLATLQTNAGVLWYYAAAYSLAGIAVFSVITYISQTKNDETLEAFKGLAHEKPALAVGMILALLSMAGIPPFAGFFAKYMVFLEAMQTGYLYIAIVAVVASIISVYYYFKVLWAMIQKPVAEGQFADVPVVYTVVLWLCALALLGLGIMPSFFINLLQ
jgi:NADH-quinone oxidoreductase subunit N